MAVKLEVKPEGDVKLIIRHERELARSYILALIALSGAGIYFLIPSEECLWGVTLLVVATVVLALSDRSLETIIDKANGTVIHKIGGYLDTKFGAKEKSYNLLEMTALEIKRYIRRWGDGFQIRLWFNSENKIDISSADLSFRESTDFANYIHAFVGKEIPLKAVD